jgi:hypothetical protein
MARKTAFAGATMTVTITEDLTINNRDYGGSQVQTIASIGNISQTIDTITDTEVEIITFSSVFAAGQYTAAKVLYMRFTNLDDTNFITLTFKNENADECAIKLDAGQSFIWNGDNSGGMVDVMNAIAAGDAASDTALGDLVSVQADANTASCDLEMLIASTT